MPDGGVGEAELAATLFETAAADDAAFGAMALAGGEGVATGVAATALDVGGGLAGPADTALTTGASGTTEIAGAGPAAQTGVTAESQTQKLAQQILQPPDELNPNPQTAPTSAEQGLSKPGIIDRATQWATKNPVPATLIGTQLAGAVGGIGKAALEKEIAERNIRARSALLTQQTQEQLDLSRRGTFTGNVGVTPAANKVLRRPDGTLVYPGIVAGQTGGA